MARICAREGFSCAGADALQTMEAMLSFLAFSAAASSILLPLDPSGPLDDSLYRLQLAEDAWRMLYLRGALRDFGEGSVAAAESELGMLGEETGLCFFIDGVRITNCRGGGEAHMIVSSITRVVIFDGKARTVTFSMGK
jgi:hypothetical protein